MEKSFGLWRSTSLVVGNVVGAGIFMLPASLGRFGTAGLLGWVITALGSIFLALSFCRLGARFPKAGGPYAYANSVLGEFVGFQVGWAYWIGCWAGNAAIATGFVSYLSVLVPSIAQNPWLSLGVALAAVWFFTLLNVLGTRWVGSFQVFAVVCKLLPLIAICVVGTFYVRVEHFVPFNPSGESLWHVISSSAALTLFAFLGFESATIPADEVKSPEKTIPRATMLGTILSAVIYIWTTVVLIGVLPLNALTNSHAPFADAAAVFFGSRAGQLIAFCAAFSAFSALNGWVLLQGQMPMAAAADGVFPARFGKLSRFKTPAFGLIISSVLLTLLLFVNYGAGLVDQFTSIVNLATFVMLLAYLYSSCADILLLLRQDQAAGAKLFKPLLGAALGFCYAVFIVAGSGKESVYLGTILVFMGFPIYFAMKQRTAPAAL